MAANSAEGVQWDLSDLFSAHDDPRIDAALNDCRARDNRSAPLRSAGHRARRRDRSSPTVYLQRYCRP